MVQLRYPPISGGVHTVLPPEHHLSRHIQNSKRGRRSSVATTASRRLSTTTAQPRGKYFLQRKNFIYAV